MNRLEKIPLVKKNGFSFGCVYLIFLLIQQKNSPPYTCILNINSYVHFPPLDMFYLLSLHNVP